jgi:hypothetical protein
MRLGPLDDDTIAGVAACTLGAAPGHDVLELAADAGRNPAPLTELLGGLKDEGRILALPLLAVPPKAGRAAVRRLPGPELFLPLARLAQHAQLGGVVPGHSVVLQLIDPPVTVTGNDVLVHRVCHDSSMSAAGVPMIRQASLFPSFAPLHSDYAHNAL